MGFISEGDAKGLEPRILADITQCQYLISLFNDPERASLIYEILGVDILGEDITTITNKAVRKQKRDVIKKVSLATNYHATAWTLRGKLFVDMGLDVSVEQCQEWLDRYMRKCPELKAYIWDKRREIIRDQQVVCSTGFVRHLPNDGPGDYRGSEADRRRAKEFGHCWNQAVNVDIQHMASIIAKLWANFIERQRRKEGLAARDLKGQAVRSTYMGPVHDSVSHDNKTKKVAQRMVEIYQEQMQFIQGRPGDTVPCPMEVLIGRRLRVPLDVECGLGVSWGDCKP